MSASATEPGSGFGHYELRELLGRGGMGEVYRAFDTVKGRMVALKILREEFAQDERFRMRFLRESHAAAMLQEPHVIPIHDWGEIDGNLYIDMRLVQGQTLHDLAKNSPLEPARAVGIVQQVAAALDAAHAQGLIHRDVKPQNIIVTDADFAYLVDFGIAEAEGDARLTMAGTQIGSFAYMAPERFSDDPCSPATDTYALACVLYEALTGSSPFPGNSYESQIAGHISSPPPSATAKNPRVPAALDAVIARGMAKEPDDRYGSAGALARAAVRAISTDGHVDQSASTQAAPIHVPVRSPSVTHEGVAHTTGPTVVLDSTVGRGRNWMIVTTLIGIALLLGAIGVVIGLLISQSDRSTEPTPTAAPPVPTHTVSGPTVIQTVPAPSSSPTSAPPSPTQMRPDPEAVSLERLRAIAADDRAFVAYRLTDVWVPQLSSKRPGVVDDGVEWDNALTLQEHLALRERYNAKLLWSGDWSTFDASNFWVTVAPVTFTTADGALAWCTYEGFDRNHCFAKLVSTTHPVRGSTKLN